MVAGGTPLEGIELCWTPFLTMLPEALGVHFTRSPGEELGGNVGNAVTSESAISQYFLNVSVNFKGQKQPRRGVPCICVYVHACMPDTFLILQDDVKSVCVTNKQPV